MMAKDELKVRKKAFFHKYNNIKFSQVVHNLFIDEIIYCRYHSQKKCNHSAVFAAVPRLRGNTLCKKNTSVKGCLIYNFDAKAVPCGKKED